MARESLARVVQGGHQEAVGEPLRKHRKKISRSARQDRPARSDFEKLHNLVNRRKVRHLLGQQITSEPSLVHQGVPRAITGDLGIVGVALGRP